MQDFMSCWAKLSRHKEPYPTQRGCTMHSLYLCSEVLEIEPER